MERPELTILLVRCRMATCHEPASFSGFRIIYTPLPPTPRGITAIKWRVKGSSRERPIESSYAAYNQFLLRPAGLSVAGSYRSNKEIELDFGSGFVVLFSSTTEHSIGTEEVATP